MTRNEWWTIVVLLSAILVTLIFNLVYQHFVWRDICEMWAIIHGEALYVEAKKEADLHVGDLEIREYWEGDGGSMGGSGADIQKSRGDAGKPRP